jgi:hypothetical protein
MRYYRSAQLADAILLVLGTATRSTLDYDADPKWVRANKLLLSRYRCAVVDTSDVMVQVT